MTLLHSLILISSCFFVYFGVAYFKAPKMKSEFKRFGLEKFGTLVAILELLGAAGLLVGLMFPAILLLSAGGLSVLMFLGVAIRLKAKDKTWLLLPALIFMSLNAYIFFASL